MSATDYVVCLNGHICCSGTPKTVANNHNYKELFGDRTSITLSIYEHKHDHTHSADGTIKTKNLILDDFYKSFNCWFGSSNIEYF